jgi:hypothetical protein
MAKASMPTARENAHRRAIVLRNMCELMKSIGQEGFDNPDDWMDSILEQPRSKTLQPSTKGRRR